MSGDYLHEVDDWLRDEYETSKGRELGMAGMSRKRKPTPKRVWQPLVTAPDWYREQKRVEVAKTVRAKFPDISDEALDDLISDEAWGNARYTVSVHLLDGDRDGIWKAANAFFLESFPESYPVEDVAPCVTGNVSGIKEIDFKKGLPQDPNKTIIPDFLTELPDSSALISWRIDDSSGNVFFA